MSNEQGALSPDERPIRKPPARTSRRRAQQITTLAQDLLETRLREDRASPTEVVAALRLASDIEMANIERVKAQTEYLRAQKAKAESEILNSELLENAMKAMGEYNGES